MRDMAADVFGETRVDIVEQILPIEERPHFPHGLIADAGDDPADIVELGIDRQSFGAPIVAGARELGTDGVAFSGARVGIAHDVGGSWIVRHIVDTGTHIDDRRKGRVRRHIGDALPSI